MTARWIASTAPWWFRALEGSSDRRRELAHHLARHSVSTVLASSSNELEVLGLRQREIKRLKAMESLVLRGRYERSMEEQLLVPKDAAELVVAELWGEHLETFVVAVLNVHNQAVLVERVHRGSIDQCTVDPREVFRPALLARGSAVVVGHNHPGGDPTPSETDIVLTRRLCEAGDALSIPLLDHIVVGGITEPHWASFAERALLARPTCHEAIE